MPSLDEVLKFREELFQQSMALIQRKGHDYNRQQQNSGDTLFNLTVAEVLGIVETAERGILVRLSDKFMRLISLMTPGVEAAVADESVRDTIKDIHNYADYALMIWEARRARTAKALASEAQPSVSPRFIMGDGVLAKVAPHYGDDKRMTDPRVR